jgi:predicted metal-dependent HD superfamily phosphohydrolase
MVTNSDHRPASAVAWRLLLQRAGADPVVAPEYFMKLEAHYSSTGRHYHDLGHIGRVLAFVSALAGHSPQPVAVRLAAWLHDVIYVPAAGDNEEQSALLAQEWLSELQLSSTLCKEVVRLIRLTASHDAPSGDGNAAVLLDADLAILGTPPPSYDDYARAIRREFAHVADSAYRAGRVQVLARFLARPTIYRTPPMRAWYEARARRNLAREIAALQGKS